MGELKMSKRGSSKNNMFDTISFLLLALIFAIGFYMGNNMTTNVFVDNPIYDNFVPKGVSDWNMVQFVTYNSAEYKYLLNLPDEYKINGVVGSQSMFPLVSSTNHNVILKTDVVLTDLNIGDVIVYSVDDDYTAIHRIIGIYNDDEGRYAVVQGDNNKEPDDIRVRSDMINSVLVGVLY